MSQTHLQTNFWRANQTREIRIGAFADNGVFRTVASVPVRGAEYSDAEARKAAALCRRLNERAA